MSNNKEELEDLRREERKFQDKPPHRRRAPYKRDRTPANIEPTEEDLDE